jgi:hypothetical protein
MESIQFTLSKIRDNCRNENRSNVKKILILQEEKILFIGDSCLWFGKMKHVSSFFGDAVIHMNFVKNQNEKFIDALLKGNPHVESITTLERNEITFENYDVVVSVSYNEQSLLQFLHDKYGEAIANDELKLAVFSLSELVLEENENARYIFPMPQYLVQYAYPQPAELYVSDEEKAWADRWLKEKGLKEGERLLILMDSTSRRDKLISLPVYFEFLCFALKQPNAKVLIFDEMGMGKEDFYREWLGSADMHKMIFAHRNTLREAIALIASSHTSLMFGPCTGLMHCASSIFNGYVNNGMPAEEVPLIVVYTGQYDPSELHAYKWWGSAPLVHCLMLKNRNGKKELRTLAGLTEYEKQMNDSLPCTEFTSNMLINFVGPKMHFADKLRNKQLVAN